MRKIVLYLIILLILTSCWTDLKNDKIINFWQFSLKIPDKFSQIHNEKLIKDFDVLYTYTAKDLIKWNPSENSIVVLKYKWSYPTDKKEFFNIVSDKFRRQIPGIEITNKYSFTKNENDIYYIIYKVYNNLFANKTLNADYYWLQAYVFSKDSLYVISYVSSSNETINIILKNLENLNINK